MLRKYTIIVILQLIGLAIITLLIVPIMIAHAGSLNRWHDFFTHCYRLFFIGHLLFYGALYFAWPHFISVLANRQKEHPSQKQINNAMRARYFLIASFLLIELLNLLR